MYVKDINMTGRVREQTKSKYNSWAAERKRRAMSYLHITLVVFKYHVKVLEAFVVRWAYARNGEPNELSASAKNIRSQFVVVVVVVVVVVWIRTSHDINEVDDVVVAAVLRKVLQQLDLSQNTLGVHQILKHIRNLFRSNGNGHTQKSNTNIVNCKFNGNATAFLFVYLFDGNFLACDGVRGRAHHAISAVPNLGQILVADIDLWVNNNNNNSSSSSKIRQHVSY